MQPTQASERHPFCIFDINNQCLAAVTSTQSTLGLSECSVSENAHFVLCGIAAWTQSNWGVWRDESPPSWLSAKRQGRKGIPTHFRKPGLFHALRAPDQIDC